MEIDPQNAPRPTRSTNLPYTSAFYSPIQFQITTPRAYPRRLVTYSTLGTARRRPLAEGVAFNGMDSHMGEAAVVEGY